MNTRYVLLLLLLGTATTSTNLLHASAPTPATWDCRTCTFRNEGTKQACDMCTTAKPLMHSTPVAASHQAWSCSVCTAVNWPDKNYCEMCATRRPAMRTAPRTDDAAFAARLQEEERMRYEREEAERTAARTRERKADEVAAKRSAEEAATQAMIAKMIAEDEADERSRRAATRLAAQYAAEEEAERLNQIEADATLAQALAEADDVRRAQEEAATQALIAKLTGADKLTQADARLAQEEADRLVALRFEAEEVANAARLNQGAARAAAEIAAARRRGEGTVTVTAVPVAAPPVPLAPVTLSAAPPALPNTTGTCFLNAMVHCICSSTRLVNQIRAIGAVSPLTTALHHVLDAYAAGAVPERLLLAFHQELLKILPPDHPRVGGDTAHIYQVLASELHRLNPTTCDNSFFNLGLPDHSTTPVTMSTLLTYYEYYRTVVTTFDGMPLARLNQHAPVLVFRLTRNLVGHAQNKKPVILEPEITIQGARFRLTGYSRSIPGHATAYRTSAAGWHFCDNDVSAKVTPNFAAGDTESHMIVYERI